MYSVTNVMLSVDFSSFIGNQVNITHFSKGLKDGYFLIMRGLFQGLLLTLSYFSLLKIKGTGLISTLRRKYVKSCSGGMSKTWFSCILVNISAPFYGGNAFIYVKKNKNKSLLCSSGAAQPGHIPEYKASFRGFSTWIWNKFSCESLNWPFAEHLPWSAAVQTWISFSINRFCTHIYVETVSSDTRFGSQERSGP